jgi:hypothetical protein
MKIKKVFIALCASALFFNVVSAEKAHAKGRVLAHSGLPFINLDSVCIDNSAVIHLLNKRNDTVTSIKCYLYQNDEDSVVVTSPIEINAQHMVFVFKVYKNDCLQFLFHTIVAKNEDIPQLYCDEGTYLICCE